MGTPTGAHVHTSTDSIGEPELAGGTRARERRELIAARARRRARHAERVELRTRLTRR